MMNRKQEYLEDLDAALDRRTFLCLAAFAGAVKVMRNLADALEKEMVSGRTPWGMGDGTS
jgi:hypothetical protein